MSKAADEKLIPKVKITVQPEPDYNLAPGELMMESVKTGRQFKTNQKTYERSFTDTKRWKIVAEGKKKVII